MVSQFGDYSIKEQLCEWLRSYEGLQIRIGRLPYPCKKQWFLPGFRHLVGYAVKIEPFFVVFNSFNLRVIMVQ